jgi:hypothetical protein
MAWDPDDELSTGPLDPQERRITRRVLRWFERRIHWHNLVRLWGVWLIGLPTAMLTVWTIIHMLTGPGTPK